MVSKNVPNYGTIWKMNNVISCILILFAKPMTCQYSHSLLLPFAIGEFQCLVSEAEHVSFLLSLSLVVGEENESFFIKVCKPLSSRHVLKTLRENPKEKTSGVFGHEAYFLPWYERRT